MAARVLRAGQLRKGLAHLLERQLGRSALFRRLQIWMRLERTITVGGLDFAVGRAVGDTQHRVRIARGLPPPSDP